MIRRATVADAPLLAHIARTSVLAITQGQPRELIAAWAEQLSENRLTEMLASQTFWVWDSDGFASLADDVLGMLYVLPSAQGKGIARKLVDHVHHQRGTQLRVDASTNALDAYLAMGFEDLGIKEKINPAGVSYEVHEMVRSMTHLVP